MWLDSERIYTVKKHCLRISGGEFFMELPMFGLGHLTALSKVLGNLMKGSEITKLLEHCRIQDNSGESTKWPRLEYAFIERQDKDRSPNAIFGFIQEALQPVRFIDRVDEYENYLTQVNQILMMVGVELRRDGQLQHVSRAETIDEVTKRTKNLRFHLIQNGVHPQVLMYCREELLQENYFHAVFEATKGLADRVREITGLIEDGSKLFDKAFSLKNPWLAFNRLSNETEKNQQNGLKEMLKGITYLVRNTTAHEVKIRWVIEEKAAIEILRTISFLHGYLDQCFAIKVFAE